MHIMGYVTFKILFLMQIEFFIVNLILEFDWKGPQEY